MVAELRLAACWATLLAVLALMAAQGSEQPANPFSPTANAAAQPVQIGSGGLIDTKAYGKLRTFDGKEESWPTWAFVARSYFGLLSPAFETCLNTAENHPGVRALADLSDQEAIHARTLYHVLVQSVEGKALSILMNVEKLNGLEGWRALVDAYQPDLGGRHTSMLMGIISPSWEKVTEGDFLESLEKWEVLIRRYQDQAVDIVSSATKIAVFMKYAPAALRGALRTNASLMGSDCDRVKKFIRDWLQSGVTYTSAGDNVAPSTPGGLMPMDVGAIDYKGKGKGKGKEGKGKGGRAKEGKGKPSDSKGTFQGECGFCWKWGHKRSECWLRQQKGKKAGKGKDKGKGKTTAAVEQTENAGTAAAIHYYMGAGEEAGPELEEYEDELWVMAIQAAGGKRDDASNENVCPYGLTEDTYDEPSTVMLRDVSGGRLSTGKQRTLRFVVETSEGRQVIVEGVFQVSRACLKLVVSAGKLSRAGYGAVLGAGGGALWHPGGGHIPLTLRGNATYFKAWSLQAPAENDPDRRGRELRKELGQVKYGTKAELWKRLEKAEATHLREQKKLQDRQRRLREGVAEPAKAPAGPQEPSAEERAQHELTHLPPEPWCEHCIKGRALDVAHRLTPLELRAQRPRVEIDYSFLKTDGTRAPEDEAAEVILSAWDESTGMATAAKTYDVNHICRWLGEFIANLGHVTIRADGEPAILNIARRLADALRNDNMVGVRGIRATLETAPRYSSQSMGGVGSFQHTLKTDVLTLRYDTEARYNFALGPGHNLWPWMVRWASFIRSRFGVKANGRTAYQDAFDTAYTGDILPFGETAMFRMPASRTGAVQGRKRVLKGDSLWRPGIFLGRTLQSSEYLFGTPDGVYTARSLRRLPVGRGADKELMATFLGLPCDTKTTLKGPRKLAVSSGGREAVAAGEPAQHDESRGADLAVPRTPGDIPGTPPGPKMPQTDRAETPQTDRAETPQTGGASAPQATIRLPTAKKGAKKDRDVLEFNRRAAEDAKVAAESTSEGSGVKRGPTEQVEDLEASVGDDSTGAGEKRAAEDPGMEVDDQGKRLCIGGVVAATLYTPADPDEMDTYALDDGDGWRLDDDEVELNEDTTGFTEQEVLDGKLKELSKMDKYDTYDPRPEEEAQGKKILDSTWVVTRRPTGEVKCRYCLRDLKRGKKRDDVFAVASSQATARVIDTVGVKKGYVFFTADAENAYWQVPIKEDVYMYPPAEWLEKRKAAGLPHQGLVWKLKKEWYGRQIAGQSFVDWAAQQAKTEDFDRCQAAPWFFYNAARDASMEVHMDDFYGTAPEREAVEFLESLSKKIVMKYKIHRPGDTFEHLKRLRTVHEDGMMVKPNPKYLEGMLETLGLKEANAAPTPESTAKETFKAEPLDEQKTFEYRSCVGKALYLSFDRPDCQHAVRELTKYMKQPTTEAMNSLRRLARYLKGTRDMGVWLPREGDLECLEAISDTDWANCKKTRKSCAGGVFMVGGCLVGSYSRGLAMICLSSGEAEFNGGVMATSEGIFYKEVFSFLRIFLKLRVWLDSSAARGIYQREGVGKVRHLETKSLWVQQGLKERKFSLHAIATETNPSDIHTKGLAVARFEILRSLLGVIEDELTAKAARATLLAGMLVGSVRKRPTKAVGGGTLAAILLAAGVGGAQGQALQPRGAGALKMYAEIAGPSLYVLVFAMAFSFFLGGFLVWLCCRGGGKQRKHTYDDVYPVNNVEGPYILRTGTRMHMLSRILCSGTRRLIEKGLGFMVYGWRFLAFNSTLVFGTPSCEMPKTPRIRDAPDQLGNMQEHADEAAAEPPQADLAEEASEEVGEDGAAEVAAEKEAAESPEAPDIPDAEEDASGPAEPEVAPAAEPAESTEVLPEDSVASDTAPNEPLRAEEAAESADADPEEDSQPESPAEAEPSSEPAEPSADPDKEHELAPEKEQAKETPAEPAGTTAADNDEAVEEPGVAAEDR
ncbi:GIP [Symbiodinium sp. CCMP2592]|nr:GIP [Symbiodinium sp. CCMP2592]